MLLANMQVAAIIAGASPTSCHAQVCLLLTEACSWQVTWPFHLLHLSRCLRSCGLWSKLLAAALPRAPPAPERAQDGRVEGCR